MPLYKDWVRKDGSNIWTTGTQDMSAATALVIPSSAGFAPTAAGSVGYDTTAGAYVAGGGLGAQAGYLWRVISKQTSTTDQLVAATINVTETAFATQFALPANYFTLGKVMRVTVGLEQLSTATIPTSIFRMRFQKAGPTNVNVYAGTATAATSTSAVGAGASFIIMGTAAAGAAVAVETSINRSIGQGNSMDRNTIAQGVAIATNAAQTLQFTWQFGGNAAGNTINIRQLIVEECG